VRPALLVPLCRTSGEVGEDGEHAAIVVIGGLQAQPAALGHRAEHIALTWAQRAQGEVARVAVQEPGDHLRVHRRSAAATRRTASANCAPFWLAVHTDLRNRGIMDVFFVVCDGLKGLPEVVGNTWLLAIVPTCIIRLIPQQLPAGLTPGLGRPQTRPQTDPHSHERHRRPRHP
jgi:Transposase, Mutator family